ncbi:MAG TPA: cupin domain-containing protein [Polyangia bacterium]|nr:cupin domain-containing protein [Polyangia bacterium]
MDSHLKSGDGNRTGFVEPKGRYPDPLLVRAADQRTLNVDLPSLADERYRRTWHRGVRAERAFARKVTLPPDGGTPIHAVTCDHVIIGLEGRTDFEMRGEVLTVEPGDLLYFPANVLYAMKNRGGGDAAFISVGIEAEFGWPPRSDYWAEPVAAPGDGHA